MTWLTRLLPFLASDSRAVLEARLDFLRDQLSQAQAQETYWRLRAERLMDAALVRAGAIHSPTMTEVKPPPPSPFAGIVAAMATTEIDSRVGKAAS